MKGFIFVIFASSCLAHAPPACAAATQSDLIVAARALSFTQDAPKGDLLVGIVYDAANAQSAAEAENLQKMFGAGLTVGKLTLKPVLVGIESVDQAAVGLFFLAGGVGVSATKVAAATKAKHILCITADTAQVENGSCVMAVRSQPKTEILVNRAAAIASGTTFEAAFRIMIKEF